MLYSLCKTGMRGMELVLLWSQSSVFFYLINSTTSNVPPVFLFLKLSDNLFTLNLFWICFSTANLPLLGGLLSYFNLKEYQKTLSIKIASNDTLISNVQQVITEIDNANILSDNIVNYKQLCNNRSNITNDINIVTLDINKLNEEYQASIEPCPYCNGSGLKHNH